MIDVSEIFSDDLHANCAIQQLLKCMDDDNSIPSIFKTLASSEDPKYFQYSTDDMFRIFDSSTFPNDIDFHYASSSKRADFGCLPKVGRYFAVIDNKAFFWRISGGILGEYICIDDEVITSVCSIKAPKEYFPKSVENLIVIGSPNFIKFYPIVNDSLLQKCSDFLQIDFTPLCMDSYMDNLVIGGSDGNIHTCKFIPLDKLADNDGRLEITNVSSKWYSFLPGLLLLRRKPQIIKIKFDPSSEFLGAIDENNRILLMSFNFNDGIIKSELYVPPKGSKIVAISFVPLSDSEQIRLIAFTSNGERLFFGTTKKLFGIKSQIGLRGERKPPLELSGNIVVDGFYILGYTFFVCKKSLIVLRIDTSQDCEFVSTYQLNGEGIVVSGFQNQYSNIPNLIKYPIVWQHFIQKPKVTILTSSGGFNVEIKTPVDHIKRLIYESSGNYNQQINDWMNCYRLNDESFACLLIDSMKNVNALYIGIESEKKISYEDSKYKNLTHMTHAFFVRTARLFFIIFQNSSFIQDIQGFYKVNPIIKNLHLDFITDLNQITDLISDYKKNIEKFEDSCDLLSQLHKFISMMIELIRFLQIISKQKSQNIMLVFDKLDVTCKNRILAPIYDNNSFVPLIIALRKFAVVLFNIVSDDSNADFLAAEISIECPTFSLSAEEHLHSAMKALEKALNSDNAQKQEYIKQATATFIHYCNYPIDLTSICSRLLQLNEFKYAIDIAIARANSIDKNERGYYWFKNGCDPKDYNGSKVFNEVYQCYEAIVDAAFNDEGLNQILKNDNEMLHICVFQRLFTTNEFVRLLQIKSPYLKEYIQDNAREFLWNYYISNNNYEAAVNELLHTLASSDSTEFSIDQRLKWIELAINYSKLTQNQKLQEDSFMFYQCANIQKSIYQKTKSDEFSTILLSVPDLIQKATELNLWDIVLQLYTISPESSIENRCIKVIDAWDNLLIGYSELSENEVSYELNKVFSKLKPNSCSLNLSSLIPIFDDFSYSRHFSLNWVSKTLINFGISKSDIYLTYIDLLNGPLCKNLPEKRLNRLIYNALWTLTQGNQCDYSLISKFVDTILSNENNPLYNETKELVSY